MEKQKILIAYFSHAGENYAEGSIVKLEEGNTAVAAKKMQQLTGAELFEICPEKPYSANYAECVKEAREELQADARPELQGTLPDLAPYDAICLGYPNWCGTMPMPVFTFLERVVTEGKILYPFCTNEGSGMGHSLDDLRKLCPKAEIGKALPLRGCRVGNADFQIENWLEGIGLWIS